MQLLGEFGISQVEMKRHVQEYEAERKSAAQGEVEMVELPNNDSSQHTPEDPLQVSQEEP